MSNQPTARLTLEQIHYLVPRDKRNGKYQCPRCHKWHFTLDEKTAEFSCKSPGCQGKATEIAATIWAKVKELESKPQRSDGPPSGSGLTLIEYAMAKQFPIPFLQQWFHLSDGAHPYYKVQSAVAFPYYKVAEGPDGTFALGECTGTKWRWGMGSDERENEKGSHAYIYGGEFLPYLENRAVREGGFSHIFLPEGESNTQTLNLAGYPALGISGAGNWRPEYAELNCLKTAKIIFVPQDPGSGGLLHVRKIAEGFPPGKVRALQLAGFKDVSELWIHHHEPWGDGRLGFARDLETAMLESKPVIQPPVEEPGFPADIGAEVFDACPILKEFVEMTLPRVQSDVNCLAADFLACAASVIGKRVYANFGSDVHYPATFHLVIGETTAGKGSGQHSAEALFALVDPQWSFHGISRHFASGEAMARIAAERTTARLTSETKDGTEEKENPHYTYGRVLLLYNEVSLLLNAAARDNSTLKGFFLTAYDGDPLENQRSKEGVIATGYALTTLGSTTPRGLTRVLHDIDFANGAANRFIWSAVQKSKAISRSERPPDYKALADQIAALLPPLGSCQQVLFSNEGAKTWDAWYYSLPTGDSLVDEACGRVPANALRLCLSFAVLDKARLVFEDSKIEIGPSHVRAAAAIMARHRATVEWYLARQMNLPGESERRAFADIVKCRDAVAKNGGQLTGQELHKLFSHRTAEQREEIAKTAGLKKYEETGTFGRREIWR